VLTETEIQLFDKSGMFDVLAGFSSQLEEAYGIGTAIVPPEELKSVNRIIITGLGGSAIGGDLLRSYLQYEIKLPVFVNRNYFLPAFAEEDTLVIVSSYSGGTEETLSAYNDAKQKNCRIICISSGGELSQMAAQDGYYVIKISKGYQPRCALAYSFIPLLLLLVKLGFIEEKENEIKQLINHIKEKSLQYTLIDDEKNNAIQLAKHIEGRIPVIYSSTDILDVVNYRWRCQLEENSETLAFGNLLPEMNHNEIVGWKKNQEILRKFVAVYLKDRDDHPRIQKRMDITREIVKPYVEVELVIESEGNTKLVRIFDLIYLGDWISYYLAILYKANPSEIENINYLKNKLTEI
jgi:glucose/mannose-6-phosphate isomerase